jgi:hypothetical protein
LDQKIEESFDAFHAIAVAGRAMVVFKANPGALIVELSPAKNKRIPDDGRVRLEHRGTIPACISQRL